MESIIKEKILEQFVKKIPDEAEEKMPVNVEINSTNVTTMAQIKTMVTNNGNYFIRYGGFQSDSNYNAIEVYSVDSLENNQAEFIFSNFEISGHRIYISDMKQEEDGRFYAVGKSTNNLYLIIFNNFIQDGFLKINKYYDKTTIGTTENNFYNVTKDNNSGIYFINTGSKLIRFEINILEGNKTSIADLVQGGTITEGYYRNQLNTLGEKIILTQLWWTDDLKYEYKKAIISSNNELPASITLNSIYYTSFSSNQVVSGETINPFEAIIPYITTGNFLAFSEIDINGNLKQSMRADKTISDNTGVYAQLLNDYAVMTDGTDIYLFHYDKTKKDLALRKFYDSVFTGGFSGVLSNIQILSKYNIDTIIGTIGGTPQKIVAIKNIYCPGVTTQYTYYNINFCNPYYLNLYSEIDDNTSLIFSRNATARFYSGNQITATFIVPNYMLNYGTIKRLDTYSETNYLMNEVIKDYDKNQYESLYFKFIYSINVIDNTNGLNKFNQEGSNRIASNIWDDFRPPEYKRLTKARVTYTDLSTGIIPLTLVSLEGGVATLTYQVTGNIKKIEYLSNDEKTVYATYNTDLTGTNNITQIVQIIPNEIRHVEGTDIYINDSSTLEFVNIQIEGNSTQNGTPTSANPVMIKNAGGSINYFNKDTILAQHLIDSSGTILEDSYNFVSDFIEIDSNMKYTISAATNKAKRIAYYDESQTFISRPVISNYSGTITTPANAKYIRLSCHNDDLNSLQLEKGSFVSSYVPYYDRMAKITEIISNKNIFDGQLELGNYDNNGEKISVNNIYRSSNFIKVVSGTTYTISIDGQSKKYVLYYYDSNKTFLSMTTSLTTGTFTTPSNCSFITFRCFAADFTSDFQNLKIQVERGANATTYMQHHEQSFTIPCQQSMRSVGNVRDFFIKIDGVWYEKHNIAVIESYNGETITSDYMSSSGQLTNGACVQYVLDNPDYIECIEEQRRVLEGIILAKTYETITNIYSTDEVPPYLDLRYYKKL